MNKSMLSGQELYIKKLKQRKNLIQFLRFLILFQFLIMWEILVRCGVIDGFFFSSPTRIINCMKEMFISGELITHILTTLTETLVSFSLVTLLSLLLASIFWASSFLSDVFEPYLIILNSLPKSALAPLFIVWLGSGIKTIIVAGISVAVFGSVVTITSGFLTTDADRVKLVRTLGGTKWDIFQKVVLPGALPMLLSCTKVNIGLSLVGVVIGEFLASRQGLGYLIIYGSQVFKLDMVITSILILCAISMLLYFGLQKTEQLLQKMR